MLEMASHTNLFIWGNLHLISWPQGCLSVRIKRHYQHHISILYKFGDSGSSSSWGLYLIAPSELNAKINGYANSFWHFGSWSFAQSIHQIFQEQWKKEWCKNHKKHFTDGRLNNAIAKKDYVKWENKTTLEFNESPVHYLTGHNWAVKQRPGMKNNFIYVLPFEYCLSRGTTPRSGRILYFGKYSDHN